MGGTPQRRTDAASALGDASFLFSPDSAFAGMAPTIHGLLLKLPAAGKLRSTLPVAAVTEKALQGALLIAGACNT